MKATLKIDERYQKGDSKLGSIVGAENTEISLPEYKFDTEISPQEQEGIDVIVNGAHGVYKGLKEGLGNALDLYEKAVENEKVIDAAEWAYDPRTQFVMGKFTELKKEVERPIMSFARSVQTGVDKIMALIKKYITTPIGRAIDWVWEKIKKVYEEVKALIGQAYQFIRAKLTEYFDVAPTEEYKKEQVRKAASDLKSGASAELKIDEKIGSDIMQNQNIAGYLNNEFKNYVNEGTIMEAPMSGRVIKFNLIILGIGFLLMLIAIMLHAALGGGGGVQYINLLVSEFTFKKNFILSKKDTILEQSMGGGVGIFKGAIDILVFPFKGALKKAFNFYQMNNERGTISGTDILCDLIFRCGLVCVLFGFLNSVVHFVGTQMG